MLPASMKELWNLLTGSRKLCHLRGGKSEKFFSNPYSFEIKLFVNFLFSSVGD